MRLLVPSLALGATAVAAVQPLQQPLGQFEEPLGQVKQHPLSELLKDKAHEYTKDPLEKIKSTLHDLSDEALQAWEEVAKLFPEQMSKLEALSHPKPHTRKVDSHWDHIVRGADIQSVWVENADGQKERDIEGNLEDFSMRIKKVDPSALGIDPDVKQYSGYLDDDKEDKHLFYWFFESRNDPENDPVVLWLNGGPGCSSLTGLFMELGPSMIGKSKKPEFNPYSWNANASVIFLDQPVNVGYSYSGGSVSNTIAAGKDVYALMTLFFNQFPEYAHQDFHIAGESYAGHYIPVFASEILSHKKRNINLKSVLIGNGLTDGYTQYAYYKPFACGEYVWPAVLSESECQSMENALPRCQSLIEGCYDSDSVWSCVPAAIYCNNAMMGPYQRTGLNVYDIRGPCEDTNNLCYEEMGFISDYLNRPDVMKALGAEVSSYDSCNMDINRAFLFAGDWMKPYYRLVPGLLEQIPVLIYAGEADFICNAMGNPAWVEALEWPGKEAFNKENLAVLEHQNSGNETGTFKSSGNLTFITIHQAGHMVPYNQPDNSLDFFNRWLAGEWLA